MVSSLEERRTVKVRSVDLVLLHTRKHAQRHRTICQKEVHRDSKRYVYRYPPVEAFPALLPPVDC